MYLWWSTHRDARRNTWLANDFEEVFLPHLDAAYNLARWLLRNDQDAEDAVQDAYLRAYKAFARFRGGDGKAWFMTIVTKRLLHDDQEAAEPRNARAFR